MKRQKLNIKKLKEEAKGITLIALVVTIIVLLILAAVAINLTIGNNGIFTRAQNATQKWEEASKNEENEMNKVVNFFDEYMNGKDEDPGGDKETVPETEAYVGYYADIEGDGTVDGVIYADLAVGNTGDGQWTDSDGNYTIPVKDNLKNYYISQKEYVGNFGTKDVLTPTGTGNERFYIMALKDIDGKSKYKCDDSKMGCKSIWRTRSM